MIEGETPEEYQRRLKREQMQRYRERKASGEAGMPGRVPYVPGPGEESREDRRKRVEREAQARYRAKPEYEEVRKAYRQSEPGKESQRRYRTKPEAKAVDATRHWATRDPKDVGSGLPAPQPEQPEPYRPQGTPSELDKAARNRERVQKGEAAKAFQKPFQKSGEKGHPWWRKLW